MLLLRSFAARVVIAAVLVVIGLAPHVGLPRSIAADTPIAPPMATFGHPTIVSVSQYGFEPDLRFDSHGNPFTTDPGTSTAGTSYMWHSADNGQSFHLVPGSTPFAGKLPTCPGGGDTEIAFDNNDRLYFNDLQSLTNFSTSRSDDEGKTFTPSCGGVPGTGVDRQWYAIDGDPLNGGHVYLTYDRVAQDQPSTNCTPGTNELVITESPPPIPDPTKTLSQTAGIEFGPTNNITPACNEGIMGPDVISPIANADGSHNVFIVHDNDALDSIFVAKCTPVAITTDPSGLQCTNTQVFAPATAKTDFVGQNFPAMDIDRAGNIYAVWSQAPRDPTQGTTEAPVVLTGPSRLYMSVSHDNGAHWTAPIDIAAASGLDGGTNVMPWVAAGDDGRIDVAWYGTTTASIGSPPVYGADNIANAAWNVYMAQSLNADCMFTSAKCKAPTFTISTVTEHITHAGSIQTLACPTTTANTVSCNRSLGDFLNIRPGPNGEAAVEFVDSTNVNGEVFGQNMFVRQTGGASLYNNRGPITGPTPPVQSVADPLGTMAPDDASFDADGAQASQAGTSLDILGSSITREDPTHLRVVMKVANLQSLAPSSGLPSTAGTVIDWLTQWHFPDGSANGGQDYFAYMESNNGAAPTFWDGTSCYEAPSDTVYPGANQITGSIDQKNDTISIDVPLKDVGSPRDNAKLYSVTASTLTLPQPANTGATSACVSGVLFNVIDSTQPYTASVGIPIARGWNLIDVPSPDLGITSTSALTNVLNAAIGPAASNQAAATYTNGRFNLFVPGYSADLPLQPSDGVFVLSSGFGAWYVYGASYATGQTVSLNPGWNLVAAPSPESGLQTDTIAAEVGGTVVQEIATYGPTSGYHVWTPGGSTSAFTVPSTSGMWIEASGAATWTPG